MLTGGGPNWVCAVDAISDAVLFRTSPFCTAGKIDPTKPIPKPDPERWIARSHRAYGKRGRKRNKFVGAQVHARQI